MRVDAIDHAVLVGVVDDDNIVGLIAVEAIQQAVEGGVQNPAGGPLPVPVTINALAVLGKTNAVGLGPAVAQVDEPAIEQKGFRAPPGHHEGPEVTLVDIGSRRARRLIPGHNFGIGDEEAPVVDQKCAGLLGQPQRPHRTVDEQGGRRFNQQRQPQRVNALTAHFQLVRVYRALHIG